MDNSLAIRDYLTDKARFPDRAMDVWIEADADGKTSISPPEEFTEEWFNEVFRTPFDAARATYFGVIHSWNGDWIRLNGAGNVQILEDYDLEQEINCIMDELVRYADANRDVLGKFGKFLDKRDADVRAKRFPIEVTESEYQYAMDVLPPIDPVPGVLEKFGCVKGFCVSECVTGDLYDTYGKTADGRMWYLGIQPGIYDLWNRKPRSVKKTVAKKVPAKKKPAVKTTKKTIKTATKTARSKRK